MDFYPVFIKLQDEPCLVVGGGDVATRKIQALVDARAAVTVVAPKIDSSINQWVLRGEVTYNRKTFSHDDLDGKRLVIAATNNKSVNREVARCAEAVGVLVNVTDDPDACRFIVPSIVDRSPLMIAISSGGNAPVLARLIRQKLEALIPAAYGHLAAFAGGLRDEVKNKLSTTGLRRAFWEKVLEGPVADKVMAGQSTSAEALFHQQLEREAANQSTIGSVSVIGAGPGDPELITIKALRLMQQADVVLYDNLVSDEVLNLVRRDAIRVSVAKQKGQHSKTQTEINHDLVKYARAGNRVCRLKGGDPFVFGRGGEELAALVEADIPFQVVPGVSAANGCAAYAGIPLTHRDYADSVTYVTGHRKNNDELDLPWSTLVNPRQTLVFYMGLSSLGRISAELVAHGLPANTPAAAVERGTTAQQRVLVGTLETLASQVSDQAFVSPTLIIVGKVVSQATSLHWFGNETQQLPMAAPLVTGISGTEPGAGRFIKQYERKA